MKIRNRIVLVLFLLSIVPMSAIVLYGYVSSLRVVEEAMTEEADALAGEIEARLALVRGDLLRRVARISRLPFREAAVEDAQMAELYRSLAAELGDAAPLVRSFEFVPEVPSVDRPRGVGAAPPPPVGDRPPPPVAPARGAGPEPRAPIVIDVHQMMAAVDSAIDNLGDETAHGMSREQLIDEARRGLELARAAAEQDGPRRLERIAIRFSGEDFEEGVADKAAANEGAANEGTERPESSDDDIGDAAENSELILAAGAAALEAAGTRDPVASFRVSLDREVEFPVYEDGTMVGEIRAEVEDEALLRRVLDRSRRRPDEVPFAVTPDGEILTATEDEQAILAEIELSARLPEPEQHGARVLDDWIIVTTDETPSGLTFGIARPIRESLSRIRATAARNFAFGAGLIAIAMIIVYPLSRGATQKLALVTEGAERLARGDFSTRVDVHVNNEVGQLARAFNEMAGELEENQQQLVKAELLKAEYDRKSEELEEARRFQLSLLPKTLPHHPRFEIAATMRTATEVGGDYYDFRTLGSEGLTIAIGDATGHGARAGTMVTVIKSLFSGYRADSGLAEFLDGAATTVRRMQLGRMSMALAIARLTAGELTLSSAGMPPALLHRADSDEVKEIPLAGMPLGGLHFAYREARIEIQSGDTLLMMSDGFPELPGSNGEILGYDRSLEHFRSVAGSAPSEVIDRLLEVAERWTGESSPADDITFVVVRVR